MEKALRQYQDLEIQLEEILSATNNFDDENNYIGGGGFGRVYKGELSHSKGRSMVAVKRLGSRCGQGIPEFLKEIRMLSRYQHENLVSLLGFCCKGHDEMILVYEYASNGSLDRHLNSPHLTWTRRINICLDVAKGISYLHDPRESHQRLIHCDIKSANILLDEQWRAKVTDFGLSIMGPAKEQDSLIVTSAVGTYGYCDPEYAMTHTLTKESDVYSFGVVLFEVLCGTLCCTYSNGRVEQILVSTWVESYKVKKLNDIIFKDPTVQPLDQSSLERFSNIAYRCLNENREDRPKMAEVVTELESALKLQEFSGQTTSYEIAADKKRGKNKDPSSSQSGTAEKDLTANLDSGNNVGQEGQNRVVQKGEKKGKMGWFTKWFKPNPILSNPTNSGQEGQNGVVKKKEKDEIERPRGETELESAPSSETVRPGGERRRSKPNPRLSNPTMNLHGEQVAAGWPAWLSAVAGEAINGWIPRRADTFEKIDKIGQGTYSNVYKAKDTMTGKIVALKKVRFDNLETESVKFMAREIVILRRLDHPNVVKLEGLITTKMSCSLYLVFEYMEHDLAGLAASPTIKFTEPQVKCYMHQLFSGLEHCHNRHVLHRDIKGSDILLDNNGSLKIADFGLASFFSPNQKHPMTSRVITLWYRPLELLLGATDYGVGIDLWSAGCILAELLAGKPIMPGRTETEQLHKIFKLCGSPSEEYWKKLKLPHANIFKPEQAYERCIAETFKNFPASSLPLIETLLAIDPAERQTATAALRSEFFTTQPYACDPSSLPKYPPTKEMDAKLRDEETRRLRAAGKSNADGVKTTRTRERHARAMPAPEANAELQANIDRRRLITHANAKKQSEKCHPPHQEGTLGYPLGSSHDMDPTFDPPDVPFSSNFSYAKQPIHPLAEPAPTGHS